MRTTFRFEPMNNIYLDIETIPTQSEKVRARLRAELIQADIEREARIRAEFKKTDTIASKIDELQRSFESRLHESWRATALDGGQGEIVAIGYVLSDGPVQVLVRTPGHSEHKLLDQFFAALRPQCVTCLPEWVGHKWLNGNARLTGRETCFKSRESSTIRPDNGVKVGS